MRVTEMPNANTLSAPIPSATKQANSTRDRLMARFKGQIPSEQPQPPPHQMHEAMPLPNVTPASAPPPSQSASTPPLPPVAAAPPTSPSPSMPPSAASEEPAPQDPTLLQQYNILARKEKAMRLKVQQQEQALQQKEEAMAQREAAIAAQEQQYKQNYIAKDRLKANTLEVLAEENLSYDDLTQQLINQTNAPIDPRIQAHIQKLESQLEKLTKSQEQEVQRQQDMEAASYKAALSKLKEDASALVANDPEFETIKATNSIQDVVDLIEKTYKRDGKLLSVAQAAKMTEDYLTDQLVRYAKIGKIQSRITPKPAELSVTTPQVQTPQDLAPKPQTQPMKTLTNASSSSRQLSVRERAIMRFNGER